jgi:hypothetical protein
VGGFPGTASKFAILGALFSVLRALGSVLLRANCPHQTFAAAHSQHSELIPIGELRFAHRLRQPKLNAVDVDFPEFCDALVATEVPGLEGKPEAEGALKVVKGDVAVGAIAPVDEVVVIDEVGAEANESGIS